MNEPSEVREKYGLMFKHTGDGGAVYSFGCPNCGSEVRVMEHPWGDDPTCLCGLSWQLVLKAEAYRHDTPEDRA